jgi:hypothetical protein
MALPPYHGNPSHCSLNGASLAGLLDSSPALQLWLQSAGLGTGCQPSPAQHGTA